MTFANPYFFLAFLPVALIGYELFGLLGRRAAIGFLAAMSCIFYAEWNPAYLLLLLGSVLVNYAFSIAIDSTRKCPGPQLFCLVAGIAANISALCYYKYLFPLLAFLTHTGVAVPAWGTVGSVILPLGISFFTFTQISYLVDLKQGAAQRESLLSYALFVTFFPHLIAGPIIHQKEMMPQFRQERRYRLNRNDMAVGLTWFTMGMFKKVMVADQIAPVADAFFAQPRHVGALPTWLGVLSYSMQLYFDFSGYSDMAVGLARMFSIHFPLNFNSPYKAASIIDYWQRWHMTLTRYIMEYVYSPLQLWVSRRRLNQGKKISRKAAATLDGFISMIAFPMFFTLFLAGIWHGAGAQFIFYGLFHGAYLVINHAWRTFVPPVSHLQKLVSGRTGVLLTYTAVLIGQVLFRSSSVHDAKRIIADMVGHDGLGAPWQISQLVLMAMLFAVVWMMPNTQEILKETRGSDQPNWSIVPRLQWRPTLAWALVVSAVFLVSMFYSTAGTTFVYYQF